MPSVEELSFHGPNPEGVRRFRLEGGILAAQFAHRGLGQLQQVVQLRFRVLIKRRDAQV